VHNIRSKEGIGQHQNITPENGQNLGDESTYMSPSPDVKAKKKKALFNYKEKFIVINENKI